MNRIPMFVPGTVGINGEVNNGPFVPDSVPIKATPLPKTVRPPGFPPALPVAIKPAETGVVATPPAVVEDRDLKAIRERKEKEDRGR